MNRKARGKIVTIVALLVVAILAGSVSWHRRLQLYQVVDSPDARFRIVVYRRCMWSSTMPGQASDAPGVVRLYDRAGRLLQESPIDMVQHIIDLKWTRTEVEVPLIFDWKLPETPAR